MKKLIFILCAILFFSGCAGKRSGKEEKRNEKTTIFWEPGPILYKNALVSNFYKDTSSGKIIIEESVKNEKTRSSMFLFSDQANEGADIFAIKCPEELAAYAKNREICNLAIYLRRNRIDLNDFWPAFRSVMQCNGKTYALPVMSSPYVLFYNKKVFDDAKIPYPNDKWVWNDMLQAAIKLTKKSKAGNFLRIGFFSQDPDIFIWQNGGWFFTQDGKQCTLDSQFAKQGFRWYCNLDLKYRVMPDFKELKGILDSYGCVDAADLFAKNRIAMFIGNKDDALRFLDNKNIVFGVSPVPRGRYKVTKLKAIVYAVSEKSLNKDEAFKFLKYLSGPAQYSIARYGCTVPARRSMANNDKYLLGSESKKCIDLKIYSNEMAYARLAENSPYISERDFNKIWKEETVLCFRGEKTPDECLDSITKRVNRLIVTKIKNKN